MAEQVIVTLSAKRREIEAYIGKLERDLEQARRDLSAIHAAVAVFSGEGPLPKSYMNLSGVFPRHELPKLCKTALADGPRSTREIATTIITTRGLDASDRHLRKAIAYKVVQVMRRWERQGKVRRNGKAQGAVVWFHFSEVLDAPSALANT
jgi:hypothetical protein